MQIAEIVLTVRVSAHSAERMKSYIINTFFSLPNGQTQQCVISKHSHVHVKYHLKIFKRLGACMRKLGASFITAESLPDSR